MHVHLYWRSIYIRICVPCSQRQLRPRPVSWPNRCEDKLNDFVCHCKGGFTGKTCDIPPDFCANNLCLNGATCINGRSNYTCRCAAGFRGTYCDDDIVNGGYGLWSAWSSCTKTCEGGVQSRSRLCNNPVPDQDGRPCVGPSRETRDCNEDKCPECRKFNTLPGGQDKLLNCSQQGTGKAICHVICKPGTEPSRVLANPYTCGAETNYVWSHMLNQPDARLPTCTNSAVPKQVALRIQIAYNVTSLEQLNPAKTKLTDLCGQNDCVRSTVCHVTPAVAGAKSVVRRSANGPSVGHTIVLVVVGTVQPASQGSTTVGSWNDITRHLEHLALVIKRATEDGSLCFSVASVPYCPINGSLLLQGVQICPAPRVLSYDGSRCVNCPAGSYYKRMKCVPCAKGHYQDREGQTECELCPADKTTAVPGAVSMDDCQDDHWGKPDNLQHLFSVSTNDDSDVTTTYVYYHNDTWFYNYYKGENDVIKSYVYNNNNNNNNNNDDDDDENGGTNNNYSNNNKDSDVTYYD
ncbi:hypothetical protein NP493_2141g00009 [Ridgeia piscesae]|uniref:EGF-like domain-containing protein n=1 Tax=Ridgeia piscesae TaxID=27915 RepID=A0AAD9N414_RIDPI|nr:hypothetical protein NP493_2141g00009 [Ridgeia piscesae]